MDLVFTVLCFLITSFGLTGAALKRQPRLTLMETVPGYYVSNVNNNGSPGSSFFSYDVADPGTGNYQFRSEERYPNGTVVGSYGYIDPRGTPMRFQYVADERGYRVSRIKQTTPNYSPPNIRGTTEPSITWTRPKKKPNKNGNNKPYFFYSRKTPNVYRLY